MDPAFDQAVFELNQGELSEPVRSQFGYHLIEVTEIQAGTVKPFEEVRDQLASEIAKRGAEGLFFDLAERLANLTYETPDSLEPAAEALGVALQTSDWIGRQGGEGVLANPKVVAAAFSDDVLGEGLNSDLIEPDPDALQAVVLRVLEHEEAAPKLLEVVREEIVTALRDERAAEAAKKAADDMLEKLRSGEKLTLSDAEYEVREPTLIGRADAGVPAAIRELAFTLARPAEGGATFGSTALANGDAALVTLSKVVDGTVEDLKEEERSLAKRELERELGTSYYERLVSDLESRADIVRKASGDASEL
jgi:peptidyl-prolyl cis-trans isomerase D